MAKNFDPNSPLIQASITSDGGNAWPVVDEPGDSGMRSTTQRPDYPESEAVVHGQLDSDLGSWSANDSTIDDDAMAPVNIPLNAPDYGMQDAGIPDDGWGPYGENAPTGLPPGSFRGAVHISDPQCKPTAHTMLGSGDDV